MTQYNDKWLSPTNILLYVGTWYLSNNQKYNFNYGKIILSISYEIVRREIKNVKTFVALLLCILLYITECEKN